MLGPFNIASMSLMIEQGSESDRNHRNRKEIRRLTSDWGFRDVEPRLNSPVSILDHGADSARQDPRMMG